MSLRAVCEAARSVLQSAAVDSAVLCLKEEQKSAVRQYPQEKLFIEDSLTLTLEITAVKGGKRTVLSRGISDEESAAALAAESIKKLSLSDESAEDLSPVASCTCTHGTLCPDVELMKQRVAEFSAFLQNDYPRVIARAFSLIHERNTVLCFDLDGNCAEEDYGSYSIDAAFTAVSDTASTPYSGFGASLADLSSPLSELFTLCDCIRSTERQLEPAAEHKPLSNTVVFAPGCQSMLWYQIMNSQLSDYALRTGSSALAGKFGEAVFDPALNLRSAPAGDRIDGMSWLNRYGALKKDSVLIENGRLTGTMLSEKCAAELGLPAGCEDFCFSLEPGDRSFDELIADIGSGLLVGRLSGGSPTLGGDISMIAKCSFLIENGHVTRPVEGVAISGNLLKALASIDGLSRELADTGSCRFPYLRLSGLSLS